MVHFQLTSPWDMELWERNQINGLYLKFKKFRIESIFSPFIFNKEMFSIIELGSNQLNLITSLIIWIQFSDLSLMHMSYNYEARVRFRIQVWVRVRDSAIFEKVGCGCSGERQEKIIKNIFIYIFYIFLPLKYS